jgi:hypothetical protein
MNSQDDANFLSRQRSSAKGRRILPRSSFLIRASFLILILFLLPRESYPQRNEVFGVTNLINDVKKRFKLSALDVKSIKPLINEENKNVLQIYVRFSGDEPEYSRRVWREMIERRRDFEAGIRPDLTKRQRAALRAARTGMERRILNYLVDDYVSFLARFLDLNEWEFEDVQDLFESESKRTYQVMTDYLSDPGLLQMEIERITEETDSRMQKILTGEKWRDYRTLGQPDAPVAFFLSEIDSDMGAEQRTIELRPGRPVTITASCGKLCR